MPRGRAGRVGRGRPAYQRFNWFTRGGEIPAYGSYDSGYITAMGSAAASWVARAAIASVLEADASSTATFESTQAEVSITDAQMLGQASATFAGAALNGGAMTSEGDQAAAWLASGTGMLVMEGDVNVGGQGVLEADGTSTMSLVANAAIAGALEADGAGAASFEATGLTSSQAALSSAGAGAATLVGAGTARAAANMPGVSDGSLVGTNAGLSAMSSAGAASVSFEGSTGSGGTATFENATEIIETADTNTLTVTPPTGLATGNKWIIYVVWDAEPGATVATPSGFNIVGSRIAGADDGWPIVYVFEKTSGASESNATLTRTGGGNYHRVAYSIRVSGTAALSIDAVGTPTTPTGTGTTIDAPDITIAQDNSLALLFAASVGTPTFGTTQTAPSGSTLVDGRSGNDVYPVAAFARQAVNAGSFAPGNWTWGASATNNNNRIGQTISIKAG